MINLSYEQKEELGYKYVTDMLSPVCPYGVKRLKSEGFYGPDDRAALDAELDNIALVLSTLNADERTVLDIHHELSALKEISGSLKTAENADLSEIDLFELTAFSLRIKSLIPMLERLAIYKKLSGVEFEDVSEVLKILDPAGTERLSFYVESSRSKELLAARNRKKELEKRLKEEPEKREEILTERLLASKDEELALGKIYREMTEALRPHLGLLAKNAESAGRLDALICKAKLAKQFGCVRPKVGTDSLIIKGAIHPEIRDALSSRGRDFMPIDIELPVGVSVLTGANMGGKSVAMKTVALNTALALSGIFVFADDAEIPCFDRIELINRDFSNAAGGLSSFGGEIVRFNEAAERLKEGGLSFIVMDEFARGTNAEEGAAIAKAVVKYLSDKNAVSILATHYDGTAKYAARHYQVKGLRKLENENIGVLKNEGLRIVENSMDYGLISVDIGQDCPRDALNICRILGMSEDILDFAENALTKE